jgi:hypothetical protein
MPPVASSSSLDGPAVALVELGRDLLVAVLVDQALEHLPVELLGIHVGDALGAAPLPVLDQVGEELAAPAHAALEEGEVEVGEAPRHAAQEQALGDRMPGRREVADMVEGEVAGRIAQAKAAAAGMEGGRDAQLAALLPDQVVVVLAVDAEILVGHGEAADRRVEILGHRYPARNAAAEHADLAAELLGAELQLGDRLLGREHRDHGGRRQPVRELGEVFVGDDVEAAHHGAPGLVVGNARDAEAGGGIDHAEIDAELVEPVVEHARHHRRGAIARVGRLARPVALHGDAALLALGDRQAERVGDAALARPRKPSRPCRLRPCACARRRPGCTRPSGRQPSMMGCFTLDRTSAGLR